MKYNCDYDDALTTDSKGVFQWTQVAYYCDDVGDDAG